MDPLVGVLVATGVGVEGATGVVVDMAVLVGVGVGIDAVAGVAVASTVNDSSFDKPLSIPDAS